MTNDFRRREFISSCIKAGVVCCTLSNSSILSATALAVSSKQNPDPKRLEYCGYHCPSECSLKKGTIENNIELKKKAYDDFRFKEKFGISFDAAKVFCYGCKVEGKPLSLTVRACSVRKCVTAKGLDCCIQCDGLVKCDKELWTSFPKLKDHVIGLQKRYMAG
jgi:hypothetical protein